MGPGADTLQTREQQNSQEQKKITQNQSFQKKPIFEQTKDIIQEKLLQKFGQEKGTEIFNTTGIQTITALKQNKPRLFTLPMDQLLPIVIDEVTGNIQEDNQEIQEDNQEIQEDNQEIQEDNQEIQEDNQEKTIINENIQKDNQEKIITDENIQKDNQEKIITDENIQKDNQEKIITDENIQKDILEEMEQGRNNIKRFSASNTTPQEEENFKNIFGKEKLSIIINRLNFLQKERPELEITDNNIKDYLKKFIKLGAKWLKLQQQAKNGEQLTTDEKIFVQKFSSLCDNIGIPLPNIGSFEENNTQKEENNTQKEDNSNQISMEQIGKQPTLIIQMNKQLDDFVKFDTTDMPNIQFSETKDINKKLDRYLAIKGNNLEPETRNILFAVKKSLKPDGTINLETLKYQNIDINQANTELKEVIKKINNSLTHQTQKRLKTIAMKNILSTLEGTFDRTNSNMSNFSEDFKCDPQNGINFDGTTLSMQGIIHGKRITIHADLKNRKISFNSFLTRDMKSGKFNVGKEGNTQLTSIEFTGLKTLYSNIHNINIDNIFSKSKSIKEFNDTLGKDLDKKMKKDIKHEKMNNHYMQKGISREIAQEAVIKESLKFIFRETGEETNDEILTRYINSENTEIQNFLRLISQTTEEEENPKKLQRLLSIFEKRRKKLQTPKVKYGKSKELAIKNLFNPIATEESIKNIKHGTGNINIFIFLSFFTNNRTGTDEKLSINKLEEGLNEFITYGTLEKTLHFKSEKYDNFINQYLEADLEKEIDNITT